MSFLAAVARIQPNSSELTQVVARPELFHDAHPALELASLWAGAELLAHSLAAGIRYDRFLPENALRAFAGDCHVLPDTERDQLDGAACAAGRACGRTRLASGAKCRGFESHHPLQ